MALIIPNIGNAALLNVSTGAIVSPFTKMDSIVLDIDSKLTEVYGGSGGYAIVNIMADRKPKVSIKGPEVPLTAATGLLGATSVVAAVGTPTQIQIVEEKTIDATSKITLDNPISATVTPVTIMGALDGKPFTGVASAPTAGQYGNPVASATQVTFNASDNGKSVVIVYSMDSTTGGHIDISPNAMPGVFKFIASAKVINTEDPAKALVPITFVVNSCQFIGNWQISQERQKASSTSLDLSVLDPGGSTPAIQIFTAAKFAG